MKKHILSTLAIIAITFSSLQAQQFFVNEDFNSGTLPTGWTVSPLSGTANWQFGIDGSFRDSSNNNIDSTNMAYFDDDALGGGNLNNTAALITPSFNNSSSTTTTLRFDYNFREYAPIDDSLYVEVFDGTNWVVVFSVTDNDCGRYTFGPNVSQKTPCENQGFPSANIDITAYANANAQVRFVYHDGDDWGFYAAIDNVTITAPISQDIAAAEVYYPVEKSCGLDSAVLPQVKVVNMGTVDAEGFDITVVVDDGNTIQTLTETVTDTVFGADSIIHEFSSTLDFSNSNTFDVTAYVDWSSDGSQANDTVRLAVANEPRFGLRYTEGFEVTPSDWVISGTSSSWDIGFPAASRISFASQGNQILATNLSGGYNSAEVSYVTTPCLDFSTKPGDPVVSFDLFRDIDGIYDRLYMQSSIDNEETWQTVFSSGISSNWYNNPSSTGIQANTFWNGSSGAWEPVENVLSGLGGNSQVKLRFVFESDLGNTRPVEGAGIDRFQIKFPDSLDLGISNLVYPEPGFTPACGYAFEEVTIQLENKGATDVDSFIVNYRLGNTTVTETVTTTFPSSSITEYTFDQVGDFTGPGPFNVTVWVEAAGDGTSTNDSIANIRIDNNVPPLLTTPFSENFDRGFTPGTNANNANSGLANGWADVSNGAYQWRVANSAANLSGGTGPSSDHTGGNGNFIYSETTEGSEDEFALIESPCLDFSDKDSITLDFWYFRYGSTIEPLFVDVFDGIRWVRGVDTLVGPNQNSRNDPWRKHAVSLNDFAGQRIKIGFRTIHGGNTARTADIAIDDVQIYQPLPQDAELISINSPISDCGVNSNSQVSVTVNNFGLDTIFAGTLFITYDVEFQNNVVQSVTDTVDVDMAPDETIDFDFTQAADLSAPGGQYTFDVYTTLQGDDNLGNDSVQNYMVTNFTRLPGYVETFESSDFLDGNCLNPLADILGRGWTVENTNFNWNLQNARVCRASNGATSTPNTGPEGDHSTGNGKFIYTEASFTGGTAILTSPCIDFRGTTGASLAFWYHRFGNTMGDLFVDVIADGTLYQGVDVLNGQTQTAHKDAWLLRGVNLSQFAGQMIQVRFRAQRGGERGDISIDDIEFFEPIPQDARVTQVLTPVTECSPDGLVTVVVENFGTDSILPNTAVANYSVDGAAAISDTVSKGIGVGDTVIHRFSTPGFFRDYNTTYRIRSWTALAGDTNSFNDSSFYTMTNLTQGLQYRENFETAQSNFCGPAAGDVLDRGWFATPPSNNNNSFHWTVHAGTCGGTPQANTGPFLDHTRGSGRFMYAVSELPGQDAFLSLPCIDFSNDTSAGMTFWYHMYGAQTGALDVEVYDDVTASWVRVFRIQGQQQTSPNDPWRQGAAKFEQFAGRELQIRFRARKGGAAGNIGLDDVAFYLPQPIDARLNAVLTPVEGCDLFEESVVSVEIENFGTGDIPADSLDLYYQVDNNPPVRETYPNALVVNEVNTYVFDSVADFSNVGQQYNIKAWTSARGEGNIDNDTLFEYAVVNETKRTPYREDFEGFNDVTYDDVIGQIMDNGWYTDNWNVQSSILQKNDLVTPRPNSGPNGDHTTGRGFFMYAPAANANLYSPCIDLQPNTEARMDFWYHMFGSGIGGIRIQADSGNGFQTVSTVTPGQKQTSADDDWSLHTVNLDAYTGKTINLRLRSFNGSGDIAIDDLVIYNPRPQDVAITDILNPGIVDACQVGGLTNVRIRVKNAGTATISSDIPVFYQVGSNTVRDTISQTITPGNSIDFTFGTQLNLSQIHGVQKLNVGARLVGDTNTFNNSLFKEINNRQPGLPYYFYDFERNAPGEFGGQNYVGDDMQGWKRSNPNPGAVGPGAYVWHVQCGPGPYVDGQPPMPPGPPTGPSGDKTFATTLENGGGCYMLVESDLNPPPFQVQDALLEFPCGEIDFTQSASNKILLTYWYHKFVADDGMGDIYIDLHDGNRWNNRIDVVRGLQQEQATNRWKRRQVVLDRFAGQPKVKIRFRAEFIGRGGDIAIDNVELLDRQPSDGAMVRIIDPESDCDLNNRERLRVQYQNVGTADILESILAYQITYTPYGGEPQTFPIVRDTAVGPNGLVRPLAFQTFEFERVDLSAPGSYQFKFWTEIEGDQNPLNDTIVETVVNETRPAPSCEDFSSMLVGQIPKTFRDFTMPNRWSGNPGAYTFGASLEGVGPTQGHTSQSQRGAAGRNNDIYLLANDADAPQPGTVARIESPCYDLTNVPAANLEFWYQAPSVNHFMEISARPVGGQWAPLDTLQGLGVFGVFQWTKASIVLTEYVGDFVEFRFRSISQDAYYAIDDVCVVIPKPQQIKLERFVTPRRNLCFYSDSEYVRLRVQNIGVDRIRNFKVVLAVDKQTRSFPVGNYLRDTIDINLGNNPPFLDPGVKLDLLFDRPDLALDLSDKVTYFFYAYVLLEGDRDFEDNYLEEYPITHLVPIELPYTEDFEFVVGEDGPAYTNGWTAFNSFYTWNVGQGLLFEGATGPAVDHTKGTSEGVYMYTDATLMELGDPANLVSRCIDLTSAINPEMRYWYYMFGNNINNLELFVNDDSGWDKVDSLFSQDRDQTNNFEEWKSRTVSLQQFAGKVIRLRFLSNRGDGENGTVAIDDISVYDRAAKDLSPRSLQEPTDDSSSCYTENQEVWVNLLNNGSDPIDFTQDTTRITVDIFKDGVFMDTTLTRTVTTNEFRNQTNTIVPLPRDSIVAVRMDQTFDMSDFGSTYRFVVEAQMVGDNITRNDQYSVSVLSQRVGGRVARALPNDTVCYGEPIQLFLQDYFGAISWEEKMATPSGQDFWNQGTSFPIDETEYITIPDTTTKYRVRICQSEEISDSMEVVVIKPPKPEAISGSGCGPGRRTIRANVRNDVTRVAAHYVNDKDSLLPGPGMPRPTPSGTFGYLTDTVFETDTFYLQSIIDTEKVPGGVCYSVERDTVYAIVNTIPDPQLVDTNRIKPCDQATNSKDSSICFNDMNVLTICKDTAFVLDAGRVGDRRDIYEWGVILPNGVTRTFEDSAALNNQTVVVDAWLLEMDEIYRYYVRVESDSGCVGFSDTISVMVTDSCITSLNELSFKDNFNIYPNPVSEDLFIRHQSVDNFRGTIRLLTVEGQLIEEAIDLPFGNLNHRIEMGKLPKGIYIIKIETEKGSFVEKIIRS